MEPVSTRLKVIDTELTNRELTLTTTLVGDPVHAVDEITNADASPLTFTRPTPATEID